MKCNRKNNIDAKITYLNWNDASVFSLLFHAIKKVNSISLINTNVGKKKE